MLSGTREEGSPSARQVWYEDGRDNYHHGSWGRKHYKFLGVVENVRQDERLALACAAKEYLRRISIIWSSSLSDCNLVQATNQYALPVLQYLMWTQHWPLSELRDVDRAARKIIVENGGKHPASLTSLLYLPREKGGRGLRSVEHEYKITKIKSLLKLYQNSDQTVNPVCVTTEGKVVTATRAGNLLKQSQEKQFLRSRKTKSDKESYSVSDGKMRA